MIAATMLRTNEDRRGYRVWEKTMGSECFGMIHRLEGEEKMMLDTALDKGSSMEDTSTGKTIQLL